MRPRLLLQSAGAGAAETLPSPLPGSHPAPPLHESNLYNGSAATAATPAILR